MASSGAQGEKRPEIDVEDVEDDEFEEFETEGPHYIVFVNCKTTCVTSCLLFA